MFNVKSCTTKIARPALADLVLGMKTDNNILKDSNLKT